MSKIEWTEKTWNPIVGCEVTSPGCKNCYAMKMAHRIQNMQPNSHYQGTTKVVNNKSVWTGVIKSAPVSIWQQPLKRRKPTMYFVNSMGDLFHSNVPDELIDFAFGIMAVAKHHTFQILTKHAERMHSYMTTYRRELHIQHELQRKAERLPPPYNYECSGEHARHAAMMQVDVLPWPLPNVWLGISAENKYWLDR